VPAELAGAAVCGVITTLTERHSGWSAGSRSIGATSSAPPPIRPAESARTSASPSTMC
jgi:hypothetical protein